MAYIEYLTSNTIEFLHTKHLFGRKNPVANKSVTCHSVSRNHASIEWDGKQWLIQDLSRNGTWVNNKRLKPNLLKELQVGDKVTLGSNNKEGVNFKVCNTDAPKSLIYRPFPSLQAI